MRYLVAVFAIALPTAAAAQRAVPGRTVAPPPATRPAAPAGQQRGAAPVTPTPPPAVLPFQQPPPPPVGGLTTGSFPFMPVDRFNPPRDLFRVPGRQSFPSRFRQPLTGGFIGGFAGGYAGPYLGDMTSASEAARANPETAPPPGMLRFAVTPLSAQVFVDSYYVGTIEDIDNQRVLLLPAGPHRIEIRATGYEPAVFDVRIESTETVTYRAALEPSRRETPARAAAPAGPTRMYVIPNCYLGNIPPRQDRLPSGCSTKQVRVIGE
jgi:hypothetical protein